ncbi:uncharacterized protein [Musca autumnalis]|uniref:uncharacterized protein n=1 Tax=Musca autumnalis TaxID=221902 RepID=UPI003CF7B945
MNETGFFQFTNYQVSSIDTIIDYDIQTQNHYSNNCELLANTSPAVEPRHHPGQNNFINETATNLCVSNNSVVSTGQTPNTFVNIPFVQIHTTDVQPQRTSYGNVFRRNISRQEEIKSEPIKSENSDASKERTNATPTPPRTPSTTQKSHSTEVATQNQNNDDDNLNEEDHHKEEDPANKVNACTIYKCSLCPYISLNEDQRNEHESVHTENSKLEGTVQHELKCPGCNNVFFVQESLEVHLRLDHIMSKEEAFKLSHSIAQNKNKVSSQPTKESSNNSEHSEPQRKSRIYLKNVECLREPNRQPIEQTENQLFVNNTNNNNSNRQQNIKAPKQKISIKSVDVLREPALLRRNSHLDNTNYNLFASGDDTNNKETDLNTIDSGSYNDNENAMAPINRNNNNENNDSGKSRKPKIYVKSVESFNLMPLEYIENHSNLFTNTTQTNSNSTHFPFIYESSSNVPPTAACNGTMSYNGGHNEMSNTTYQLNINSTPTDNSYLLDNQLYVVNNVETMDMNNCGGQIENITLITDATPPPDVSTINLEEPSASMNKNFYPIQEPHRCTLHLRTVDELNLMNENELQHPTNGEMNHFNVNKNPINQEQRGTLHLRTVDELNLMNENEVQHLIAPNLDNNHSASDVLDNNINMNDGNLIGDGLYDDSDAFKFQDLDSQMANEWPETYDDLAEDINGIITDVTNNSVANNNNREEHNIYTSMEDNQKTFPNGMEVDTPQVSLITIRDIEELTGGSGLHDMGHNTNYVNDGTTDVAASLGNTMEPIENSSMTKDSCGTTEGTGSTENLKRELSNATPETKDCATLKNPCDTHTPTIAVESNNEVAVTPEARSPILTTLSVCEINAKSPIISAINNLRSDLCEIPNNKQNSVTVSSSLEREGLAPSHIPGHDDNVVHTAISTVPLVTIPHLSTPQCSPTTSSIDIPVPVSESISTNSPNPDATTHHAPEAEFTVPQDNTPPHAESQVAPAEKGRIYVANNLMETPKKLVTALSVRGRPFGSNRTRMVLEPTSTNEVFVKCNFKGCAFRFKKDDTLEYHKKCHLTDSSNLTSNQVAMCPECKSTEFSNWNTLHTHLWRAHQIDMELYKCELCDFKTPIFSRLANTHAKIHYDDRNYKCEQCGKGFKNSKQLKNHRRWHRVQANSNNSPSVPPPKELPQPNIYRCPNCGSTFSHQKTLKEHCCKNSESSMMKCDVCHKVMSTKASLKLHLLTHKKEKRFKCQQCDYATNDHNAFRRHRMGHENKKMYDCQFCEYKSVQSVTYQKHIRHKHPDKADTVLHKCSYCPYTTINRSLLIVHQAKHHKEMDNGIPKTADVVNDSAAANKIIENSVTNVVTEGINILEKSMIVTTTDVQKSKIKVKSNLFTI